jgi:hypothetical protein
LWALLSGSSLNAQVEPLTVTAFSEPLRCFGDLDGELSWEVSGGTAPYTYEWSRQNNAFVFAAGSQEMEGAFGPIGGGLEANTYRLKITDAAGAMVTTTVELISPPPIQVTAIEVVPVSCGSLCDGAILMEIGGGTGELTVIWADDMASTSANRNDLCAGEYPFRLVDERGCSQIGIVPVDGPAPLALSATAAATSCQGGTDGSLSVAVSGGTGEYNYAWSTGSNSATMENVAATDYGLTITDDNNCMLDTVLSVSDGPELLANTQIGYGCGDGRILINPLPINGTAPYTYQWSTGQQSSYLYGASVGLYGLTLTDAQGCAVSETIEVQYVAPLVVTAQVTDVSCFGAQDGEVALDISGGLPPFTITWETGNVGMTVGNLSGGTYTYNIAASGCGEARSVQVAEPADIEIDVYYELQTNGLLTASAVVSGGIPPYQLTWSNGATTPDVYDLNPDQTYELTVTDATACTRQLEIQPALTSTEDLIIGEVSVFPNPHYGFFQVATSASERSSYRIFSASGQVVRDWQTLPFSGGVDISSSPKGVYLLQLRVGAKLATVRMVKL